MGHKDFTQQAVETAAKWLRKSHQLSANQDTKLENKLSMLVCDDQSKNIVVALFDQAFRSQLAGRNVGRFAHLLKKHGVPPSFPAIDRLLMQLFIQFGAWAPPLSFWLLKKNIIANTSKVVINDAPQNLSSHIQQREKAGYRLNLNLLGELVLGENEAQQRLSGYLEALKNPLINYISVKISSIYSQIHPLSHHHSKLILSERMAKLFQEALNNPIQAEGRKIAKMINMDMEEYKDLRLTYEVFTETLERDEFLKLRAGIVIQSYLPDSWGYYCKLLEWSKRRIASGGEPIKIRLVKGANLQMELVESSLHGWESPVFSSKIETDANFKKILSVAVLPENICAVNLGIASHNLFDLAYADALSTHYQTQDKMDFEMLEGVSEGNRDAIHASKHNFILYAPVAASDQFLNAVTYLIRRLDENTAPENYLRHSFGMQENSQEWEYLKQQFLDGVALSATVSAERRRKPTLFVDETVTPSWQTKIFKNEPETDFHLPENFEWIERIRKKWLDTINQDFLEIPVKIESEETRTNLFQDFFNPNTTEHEHIYRVHLSDQNLIHKALDAAGQDKSGWSRLSREERCAKVSNVANELRRNRGELIGCMAATTGKVFLEGDNEVTEAIDFAEYYPYSLKKLHDETKLEGQEKGVVLVITPWNFPVAIPAGGILAALVTGNRVILKPAPEAMPIAWELARCFWNAGIPEDALQVINCDEGEDLRTLTSNPIINQIIFTGGTDTVRKIMMLRPDILISAETGGKNAIVVTSMADWDQVVKNVMNSAFSNTGQKCSAASLLILEKELFDNAKFKEKLVDAAKSFCVGSAFNLETFMGPLVNKPSGNLEQALRTLEDGEEWLVRPEVSQDNPHLVSPGIKWNVRPGSHCHSEELFGPVLSVLRAEDLNDAISKINQDFGLTSGIESLDEREIEQWKQSVGAGNLYVNRGITGAIVNRQPFGGFLNSKSSYGSGIKAGGPNYVLQFMKIKNDIDLVNDNVELSPEFQDSIYDEIRTTVKSYDWWIRNYFSKEYDESKILGQDNILRYLKGQKPFLLKIGETSNLNHILKVLAAAKLCELEPIISVHPKFTQIELLKAGRTPGTVFIDSDSDLKAHLSQVCFVRLFGTDDEFDEIRMKSAEAGVGCIDHEPFDNGRLELVYYLQEQSISENYHRWGNMGFRG